MSDLSNQTKTEIRQLPWMLGKLLGGILAVAGVVGVALIWTGRSGPLLTSLLPYVISALLGFLLFCICSRAMAQGNESRARRALPAARSHLQMNLVSWSLLLLFMIVFLLVTYFATR